MRTVCERKDEKFVLENLLDWFWLAFTCSFERDLLHKIRNMSQQIIVAVKINNLRFVCN